MSPTQQDVERRRPMAPVWLLAMRNGKEEKSKALSIPVHLKRLRIQGLAPRPPNRDVICSMPC